MTLLATSTAEHRNAVKILFYGQSITEQDWWREIAADLRKRFPFADLTIENRAIGGHSSQLLHRTAEADLYPFYPDLVIFHVYGAHNHYEDIIRRIRERTTAEVLIQTDHLGKNDKLDEPTDPASSPAQWNSFMNYNFLPGLGTKYNIGIVNQRNIWKQYLKDYQLAPEALLKDDVHLNENGCQLMAAIVNQWLFYQPRTSRTDWENLVRNLPAPAMADGKITFEFEGNRIDAINSTTTAEVLIDGQPVSAQRGVYAFTRTSGYNGTNWPCLLKVDRGPTAPQEEDWTVTLQEANDDYTSFNFTLTGSKTGPDGSGKAGQKFVSNSGRIAIQPEDWNLNFSRKVFKKPLPADFKIQWRSRLLGTDHLTAGDRVILAQGLTNGKHTLTLSGMHSGEGVGGFTVYRPPLVAKNP
ncbi:MAG: SGNH/GDSL hydrolase family protein [Verrucomicrobiaceae bacterium]|nr:MAG: SGNH/GDSL hydrolase family protein [Verrucomicrobiaceae bacterium]